ncbi:hypothetical protein [Mucisphaera sp.]|uniref:hypothetical protein n=1 Tax=Mucisphaera sp. TaxID=2913024 RepID=UPI003D0F21AE
MTPRPPDQPASQHTAPSDPLIDGLLDEVLSPGEAPAGLEQKILAQTTPMIEQPPAVLAKVTPGRWVWRGVRIAALLALVAGVGWAVLSQTQSPATNPEQQIAERSLDEEAEALAMALADVSLVSDFDDGLDDRFDSLRADISAARSQRDGVIAGQDTASALLQAEWEELYEATEHWF